MTRLIITATKYFIIGHTKTQEFFTFHSCLDKFSSERELGLCKHIFHTDMQFNGYRSLIRRGRESILSVSVLSRSRCREGVVRPLAFDEWVDGTHRLAVVSCGPGKGTFLMLPGGHGPRQQRSRRVCTNTEHGGPITRSAIAPLPHLCSRRFNVSERIPSAQQLDKQKQLRVRVETFIQTDKQVTKRACMWGCKQMSQTQIRTRVIKKKKTELDLFIAVKCISFSVY